MHPRQLFREHEGNFTMYSNMKAGKNLRIVKGHTAKNMHVLYFDAEYNPIKALENRDGVIKEYPFPEKSRIFYEVEMDVADILKRELGIAEGDKYE